jgi:hypothetical protein
MATLPATGAIISMGKVQQANNNVAAGTGANAPTGSINVKLSAVLGVNYGGKSAGAQISFSSTFGGLTTPYTYPP